jgi:hypothetical protein
MGLTTQMREVPAQLFWIEASGVTGVLNAG